MSQRKKKELNKEYSILRKLRQEKKITDEFEVMLGSLSLEDLISLKLEISSRLFRGKVVGIPIWKSLPYILRESMLRHFGFELSSRLEVDLIYEKLIQAGINATKPVFVDKNTGYVCMTQDPEKRWVEFSYGQDVSPSNWG